MNKRAIFPGSFDPFTLGHEAVVVKSLELFDEVIIAIGCNNEKTTSYPIEKKIAMIKKIYKNNSKVKVKTFNNLTVDFCETTNCTHIIRGLRNSADFEYERNIADANKMLKPKISTVFFLTPPEYSAISSRLVRDLVKYNSNIEKFVPSAIIADVLSVD